jgi:tRNA (guanine9-N1)-methyltransferase
MADPEAKETTPSSLPQIAPPLSKNALKRQLKRQRWEESKPERRAIKKAKLKQKKQAIKLTGEKPPTRRKFPIEGQENSGVRVVIDCGFDELMTDKVVPRRFD